MYALLVYRGMLEGGNPLLTAKAGDHLSVKESCQKYYLFCQLAGDIPLDGMPLSPGQVSDSTRRLLLRMGSKPRGHRAHRSGGVSRVLITNLLENRGKRIDGGVENVAVRWGGGHKTMYESLALDEYINVTAIALESAMTPPSGQRA